MPAPLKPQAPRLSPGEAQVIAIFVKMAQTLGAPRSLGEIYGLLFATARPLSFQDINDRLDLSKGSVSQGLRFLRTVGAIQSVVMEGDRREYFEPVVELRALVGGFLKERINPQLEEWGVRAKALRIEDFARAESDEPTANSSEAPSGLKAKSLQLAAQQKRKIIEGRLDKLKTWQKRADTVLPMVSKLLG
jgi:DNA-binding transcriptional regulator GbsR (MarR family)